MPPVGFEPTISAGERPQTYALDRATTGTGIICMYINIYIYVHNINICIFMYIHIAYIYTYISIMYVYKHMYVPASEMELLHPLRS
jgi:hypothetical protein